MVLKIICSAYVPSFYSHSKNVPSTYIFSTNMYVCTPFDLLLWHNVILNNALCYYICHNTFKAHKCLLLTCTFYVSSLDSGNPRQLTPLSVFDNYGPVFINSTSISAMSFLSKDLFPYHLEVFGVTQVFIGKKTFTVFR